MRLALLIGAALACAGSPAVAGELLPGGKLLLTRGVTNVEGAAGGGLATWSLIAGNETDAGIGGSAFATNLSLSDYDFRAFGGAVGFFDRLEVSYARQEFDTGKTGALLGIGEGYRFEQDVIGAKLRIAGDAVYDQDSWLPQIAVGAQMKINRNDSLVATLGASGDHSTDLYVAATKILLSQSLLLSGAVRFTEANQFGLLGYGAADEKHSAQFEGSAGYMLTDRFVVGAEMRTKPDNLGFAKEDNAYDAFAAYALSHNYTITAAYVDLGSIVTFDNQRGLYLSLQAGF